MPLLAEQVAYYRARAPEYHQLLRHVEAVTVVDASPEMLALASDRVGGDERVRFIRADIFSWRPAARRRGAKPRGPRSARPRESPTR
jgi:SAM-dependent methyltransferase